MHIDTQQVLTPPNAAVEPVLQKMLLLDEPFGALDALTRGTIQDARVRHFAPPNLLAFQ